MTASSHFGFVINTDDVSPYQSTTLEQSGDAAAGGSPAVKLPSLKIADWKWLQSYYDDAETPESKFVSLAVKKIDSQRRYEGGPCTVVEEYLQM